MDLFFCLLRILHNKRTLIIYGVYEIASQIAEVVYAIDTQIDMRNQTLTLEAICIFLIALIFYFTYNDALAPGLINTIYL